MMHYLSLRINAHATEDTEQVRSTVRLLLPPYKKGTVVSRYDIISEIVGHYGNQITTMEVKLNRKKHEHAFP
jgi:RNA binding exosome subunit